MIAIRQATNDLADTRACGSGCTDDGNRGQPTGTHDERSTYRTYRQPREQPG
ncbi:MULTISPECIES: hypothetical protein [Pseudomonas]|uniref:hypothetical protein n=1 Tax=Pseudomonas TaxID=286 RepID=UPI001B562609|nr:MULTISPECIES: hypothetical protein [unclassified Pseudomonas]MBP1127126.1 hypothetical protein [Pseudomonas sp. PvP025]MDQ0400986.1 hypothetical protein [Pseudomonas sp. PvP006]